MQADPSIFGEKGPAAKPRLLVADDSALQRLALSAFLRQNGYDVNETVDGRAAVEYIKQHRVDLLLLDLSMPHGDGFEVLGYLYEHHRSLPVIVLSGMAVDDIQHGIHRMRKNYLPPLLLKPIDPEQLLQMVELQLGGMLPDLN